MKNSLLDSFLILMKQCITLQTLGFQAKLISKYNLQILLKDHFENVME